MVESGAKEIGGDIYISPPICGFYLFPNPNSRLYLSMFFSLFKYIPHLFISITLYLLYISLAIQVQAYFFQSLSLLVVRYSNLLHTVSLITNNYFYLSNRKEIENDTANLQSIDRNRKKGIRRLD